MPVSTPYTPVSDEVKKIVTPTDHVKVIGSWPFGDVAPSVFGHFPGLHPLPVHKISSEINESNPTYSLARGMTEAMLEILGEGHVVSIDLHRDRPTPSESPQILTEPIRALQQRHESLALSVLGPSNELFQASIPLPPNMDRRGILDSFLRIMTNFTLVAELKKNIGRSDPPTIQ